MAKPGARPGAALVVLNGGGDSAPALGGGLSALLDGGVGIKGICGTSAGAFVGAYYCGGRFPVGGHYSDVIKNFLPQNYVSRRWFGLPRDNPSKYTTKKLRRFLTQHLKPTFGDCRIPFACVAVDLATKRQVIFSTQKTPDASLALAVLASGSPPYLFPAVEIDGRRHTDGGLTSNLCVDAEGLWGEDLSDVIALRLLQPGKAPKNPSGPFELGAACIEASIFENEREDIRDGVARGAQVIDIQIDNESLDLHLTSSDAVKLWDAGYAQVSLALRGMG